MHTERERIIFQLTCSSNLAETNYTRQSFDGPDPLIKKLFIETSNIAFSYDNAQMHVINMSAIAPAHMIYTEREREGGGFLMQCEWHVT